MKTKTNLTRFCILVLVVSLILCAFLSNTTFAAQIEPYSVNSDVYGWALATSRITVYDIDFNPIGAIYGGEGFTVKGESHINFLNEYGFIEPMDAYFISHSTPYGSGMQRGFILKSDERFFDSYSSITSWGYAAGDIDVYYGTLTDRYAKIGVVQTEELVSVLAEKDGWYCIEYDSNLGRIRGWCLKSSIEMNGSAVKTLGDLPCGSQYVGQDRTYSARPVYGGPGVNYKFLGMLGGETGTETVFVISDDFVCNGQRWANVTFSAPYGTKRWIGYIQID